MRCRDRICRRPRAGFSIAGSPEKCGRLAHNTPGKMWERRGGAHSGARLDPTLMCSWPPLSSPLAYLPPERAVETYATLELDNVLRLPLFVLAVRVFSQGTLVTRSRILVGVPSGASACILSSNTAHSWGFSGWQAGRLSGGPICRASCARAAWVR